MSFGAVAGAVVGGVASAAVGSALGGGGSGTQAAAAAADPFASQRGQYQTMLSNLINNPSSITSTPQYQFAMQQGTAAVNGSMAAGGYLNSGNRASALQTEGQNVANSQLQNQELLLAQLAGANVGSPGTAGQILNGQNAAAGAAANSIGSALGSAVTGYINGGSSSNYGFSMPSGYDNGSYGVGQNTYGFSTGAASDPTYGVDYGFSA